MIICTPRYFGDALQLAVIALLPEASFGLRALSVRPYVCPCVCVCHPRVCPRYNSSPVKTWIAFLVMVVGGLVLIYKVKFNLKIKIWLWSVWPLEITQYNIAMINKAVLRSRLFQRLHMYTDLGSRGYFSV